MAKKKKPEDELTGNPLDIVGGRTREVAEMPRGDKIKHVFSNATGGFLFPITGAANRDKFVRERAILGNEAQIKAGNQRRLNTEEVLRKAGRDAGFGEDQIRRLLGSAGFAPVAGGAAEMEEAITQGEAAVGARSQEVANRQAKASVDAGNLDVAGRASDVALANVQGQLQARDALQAAGRQEAVNKQGVQEVQAGQLDIADRINELNRIISSAKIENPELIAEIGKIQQMTEAHKASADKQQAIGASRYQSAANSQNLPEESANTAVATTREAGNKANLQNTANATLIPAQAELAKNAVTEAAGMTPEKIKAGQLQNAETRQRLEEAQRQERLRQTLFGNNMMTMPGTSVIIGPSQTPGGSPQILAAPMFTPPFGYPTPRYGDVLKTDYGAMPSPDGYKIPVNSQRLLELLQKGGFQ